jgi:hypothetical protein
VSLASTPMPMLGPFATSTIARPPEAQVGSSVRSGLKRATIKDAVPPSFVPLPTTKAFVPLATTA